MLWLLFIPATPALVFMAQSYPGTTESVYSASLYPVIARLLPFQYLPYFSFAEVIFVAAPVTIIVVLIFFVIRLVRKKRDRLRRALEALQRFFIVAGVCYFLFYFLWGFNYYREPYGVIAGLQEVPSTSGELYALCADLVGETNAARSKLPSADGGALAYDPSVFELQAMARLAYVKAKDDGIAGIVEAHGYAKPLLGSRLVSYTGITGIYFPFTAEPNFNNDVTAPSKGSSVCHEIAHRQGYAREDEANFIAYIVCTNSDDDYLRYSGYFLALRHAMDRLYGADRDAYRELRGLYSEEVAADISANRDYWRMFEGSVEERVTQINDSYLKTHNQDDGVQSYGRMVDLMLAQKRLADAAPAGSG